MFYSFPLCIQLPACDDLEKPDFVRSMHMLAQHGFYGVELNLLDFSEKTVASLERILAQTGLKLTMVASGAWAKQNHFSLSSADEEIRKSSVQQLCTVLDFAARFHAGVICGFLKGGAEGDRQTAGAQMRRSIEQLCQAQALNQAPLYLEATNHYEALLVNTLREGCEFARVAESAGQRLFILPDTYHMNIEEQNTFAALTAFHDLYQNIHLSDNNRYYPGFGSIDFCAVLRVLMANGYQGTISIEGRNWASLEEDVAVSCRYLQDGGERASRQIY